MSNITSSSICQLKNLNPYITTKPEEEAKKLERDALVWKTLAIISTVAFTAIMGVALAFSFGLVAIPAVVFAPLILSTIPLNSSIVKCFIKQRQSSELAKIERGVEEKLRAIANWEATDVNNFLKENEIESPENENLRLALLPGIARYQYYNELATKTYEGAKKDLTLKFENKHLEDSCHLDALQRLELNVFPALIKASRMLEILRQPNSEMNLEEDRLVLKSFAQRMLHRHYTPNRNDDYVKLKSGSITFEELYEDPNSISLRGRLFPAVV